MPQPLAEVSMKRMRPASRNDLFSHRGQRNAIHFGKGSLDLTHHFD